VDIASLLTWLQETGLATGIRDSLYLFPLIESAHVIGLALVFGTIAVIDLRLLGAASAGRSFRRMSSEIMKWTWAAFALTALTGVLMFITNATTYFHNTYFRVKIALLVLAAINVVAFELTAGRTVREWDQAPAAPRAGRTVATVSLVLWIAVIVAGRMIGFTVTRAASPEQAPAEINFEDLLGLPAESGTPAPTPPDNR
jgi:uncharacterized membrane protein